MKVLTLSQACDGMILYSRATGKSEGTIRNYGTSFRKLHRFFPDDPLFASITRDQLVAFLAWLQGDYVTEPDGAAPRGKMKLAPKTVYNIYTDISALWTWATKEGVVETQIVRTIDPPEFEVPAIEPYTKDEVEAMLKACDYSRTWKNRDTAYRRPTADRDRAIIKVLVDTGIRAQELCDIQFRDLDLRGNSLRVAGKGRGRDKKERYVRIGSRTVRTLWRFLTPRLETLEEDSWLFFVGPAEDPRKLKPDILLQLLQRIGERAGVKGVTTHRFRHTFAISYLRNKGDVFTLQRLLGHTTLKMVNRYLRIAQADCAEVHKRASPVDNWRL